MAERTACILQRYDDCDMYIVALLFRIAIQHLATIHPLKTKYTICAIIEKRWKSKCAWYVSLYILHIVAYIGYVNPNDRQRFAGVLVAQTRLYSVLVWTKNMWFRGEQSSKNRKLTHVCWTKRKYFNVVHLMENVCFGFYGWNVFVCSTTVCFQMKNKSAQMRTLSLFFFIVVCSYIFLLFLCYDTYLVHIQRIYRWSDAFWKAHTHIETEQVLAIFSLHKMTCNKYWWKMFIICVMI